MRKLIIGLSFLPLLAACEPTVEGLAKDHEKRKEIMAECLEMGLQAAMDNKRCQIAAEAQQLAIKQGLENLADQIIP